MKYRHHKVNPGLMKKLENISSKKFIKASTTRHFVERAYERHNFSCVGHFLTAIPYYFQNGHFCTLRKKEGAYHRNLIGLYYGRVIILLDEDKRNKNIVHLITTDKKERYTPCNIRSSNVERAIILNPIKTEKWLEGIIEKEATRILEEEIIEL